MADYFQNGVITTLQSLGDRPLQELEDELRKYSQKQKVVLILPALFLEFEQEAMPNIIEQLKGADYLHRIVLSLDRANEKQFREAREAMSVLPCDVKIIWNDGPRVQGLLKTLQDAEFAIAEQGKGRGVWLAMGYTLTDKDVYSIALHDCDIVDYTREMLARLIYPVVHPATDFEFSKGYYARVGDKLYGRVTRLFYTPFVRTLKRLQLRGAERFLDYLDSFRYALAGEFAFIRSLAKGIRISPGWGLEVSLLSEVFDKTNVQRVCQVEIADNYEHKHRQLSKGDTTSGLTKMATDIAKTLFRVFAQNGVVLTDSMFNTILATYSLESRHAIEQFHAVALLNGISYDRHAEIEAVDSYVEALKEAYVSYLDDPFGAPLMSAWVRIRAALPDFSEQLKEAVEADNA